MKPTDEVTGKVVAWWMQWNRGCVFIQPLGFMEGGGDIEEETFGTIKDPRTDMGTALELLHHIAGIGDGLMITREDKGWLVYTDNWDYNEYTGTLMAELPISGPAFCEAVVNLAETVRQSQQKQPTTKES